MLLVATPTITKKNTANNTGKAKYECILLMTLQLKNFHAIIAKYRVITNIIAPNIL